MACMLAAAGTLRIVRAGCPIYPHGGIPAGRGGARFAGIAIRRHLLLLDAVVPVLVAGVIVAGTLLHGGSSVRPIPIALGGLAAGSLFARRRAPGWTLAISGTLVAVQFHLDHAAGAIGVLAPAVALYSLALDRGRTQQVLAAGAAVSAVIVADLLHHGRPTVGQTLGHLALVAIPLLAAEAVRNHRSYLSVLLERLRLAEHTREQEAQRRAERERMRIARELHDVVAHTLTTINIQAGAAAERAGPGEPRTALETIEDASREAIAELRGIVGVLRDPEGSAAPDAPAPGVGDIPQLVARSRETGLEVGLELTGEQPARLSDAVSLAAYRILQESLTNVRRHAPGATARVRVGFEPTQLAISVENGIGDARSVNGASPGVGIAGMRERAVAVGGRLDASTTREGFRVRAELPYVPHP